jgi:hypothetical protein
METDFAPSKLTSRASARRTSYSSRIVTSVRRRTGDPRSLPVSLLVLEVMFLAQRGDHRNQVVGPVGESAGGVVAPVVALPLRGAGGGTGEVDKLATVQLSATRAYHQHTTGPLDECCEDLRPTTP